MEGGGRGSLLDPGAAEFHPATSQLSLGHPQIYYTYPPPPPPSLPRPLPQPVVTVSVFPLQQQLHHMEVVAPAVAVATRAVELSMVPRNVGEAELRAAMEVFGGVRAVEMRRLVEEGVVIIHYFDLRSAEVAVMEVRKTHARLHARIGYGGNWAAQWLGNGGGRGTVAGHPVWAQFAADLNDPNQGSLLVHNSDTGLSLRVIRELFEPFGDLKEAREMPSMVEFYDTRDAARAFSELKGKEVNGRRLVLEFSRPGFNSYASNYPRSSGHGHGGQQNIPFAPRFSRGSQPPSRWSQASGACSRSAQSSSSSSPSVAARSNSSATASVVAKSGAGTSGRRKKSGSGGGGGSSSSYSHPSPSPSSSSSRQHLSGGGSSGSSSGRRSWKSRSKSSGEARFLFKEEESAAAAAAAAGAAAAAAAAAASQSSCRDSRTTVMIKNIPNKYSQKLLLNMLDNHCIQCNAQISEGGAGAQPYSAYDFVYLPIDFNNKCNVGYGFVNLTSPEAAFRLYKAFHQQPWEVFNSRKICQVTYARLQGLEVLKEHFRNSKFACDNDEYMPVVFSPPRDGKQLTDPVPVAVGRALERCASLSDEAASQHAASSTTASTHAPSDVAEGGDDNEGDDDDDSSDGGDETAAGLSREAALRLSCG